MSTDTQLKHVLAPSTRRDTHRQADGFALGTPDGFVTHEGDAPEVRPRLVLDDLIEDTIGRLPHASRLYPEVYAWKVSDAIIAALDEVQDQDTLVDAIRWEIEK